VSSVAEKAWAIALVLPETWMMVSALFTWVTFNPFFVR
jgi:hypothetical protein